MFFDQSPVVSVPCGENAFGAVTSIYTTKVPWRGFKILSQSQNASYTSFIQLYIGSVAFGPIFVSDGVPDSCWVYDVPLLIPPGSALSAEVYYNATSANNCNIQLIGFTDKREEILSAYDALGVSAGSSGVGCPSGAWTQIGGALPSTIIRRMRINAQNTSTLNGGSFNVGVGPSSTSITTILSNLNYGNTGNSYGWVHHRFRTKFLGTGNYLWIYPHAAYNSSNIYIGY